MMPSCSIRAPTLALRRENRSAAEHANARTALLPASVYPTLTKTKRVGRGDRIGEKTRVARCTCGGVSATAEGEPEIVSLCNCTQCQRRTGSPFGIGAYFPHSAVRLAGTTKTFIRRVENSERVVTNYFCPDCGGTVYWTTDLLPHHIGIAIGHFADPTFNPPMRAVWTQHMHEWVRLPPNLPTFPKAAS